MSAADDNTTGPPLTSGSTWIQLYRGEEAVGIPIEIVAARNAYHLTELVKEKQAVALQYCDAADLVVYPLGTPLNDLSNNNRLEPVESVPGGRTEAQPLIVMAPVVWIQLYVGNQKSGQATKILCKRDLDIDDFTKLVKENQAVVLQSCNAEDLVVYPHDTVDFRGDGLSTTPDGTTKEQPLIVMAPVVWIQLYVGNQKSGRATKILCKCDLDIDDFTKLVKENQAVVLQSCNAEDLVVYPHGTLDFRGDGLSTTPDGTTKEQPLIVRACSSMMQYDVWIQLYVGDQGKMPVMRLCCNHDSIIGNLINMVKAKHSDVLQHCTADSLIVYRHGTPLDALNDDALLGSTGLVPDGTTEALPLIVKAPTTGQVSSQARSSRVASIHFGMDVALKHTFDTERFESRVMALFKWHSDEKEAKEYMAPCFPLIQSSGMGKTKLFFEFNNICDSKVEIECKIVLCTNSDCFESNPSFVREVLKVPDTSLASMADLRNAIVNRMNEIIKECKKEKLVLLFDESQFLLEKHGFVFRCIRWWLRERSVRVIQVVAVFAGTTSQLANFFREDTPTNFSRNTEVDCYSGGKQLYPPFFDLCTIGIFATSEPLAITSNGETDYDKAIPYGRPLFALIHKERELNVEKERNILWRMLLSDQNWSKNRKAWLSILGTRAQMGQTSLEVTSDLISKGYANLTYYESSHNAGDQVAQMCYFPDPVCARLAMGLMDEDWSLDGFENKGEKKRIWMERATQLFSTGLCRPQKGDLGEVAAALYMLFCGDVLRSKLSPMNLQKKSLYKTFSVKLVDWFGGMDPAFTTAINSEKPFKRFSIPRSAKTSRSQKKTHVKWSEGTISFIQVCRNYMRISMNQLASSEFLMHMYQSGCAFYMYGNCPAIDIAASICVEGTYHPLVISVKTRLVFTPGEADIACQAMRAALENGNVLSGICILLLIGLEAANTTYASRLHSDHLTSEDVESCIISKVIVVPKNDSFGVTDFITQTTVGGNGTSEVYASHGFLTNFMYPYKDKDTNVEESASLLRCSAPSEDKNYLKDFVKCLWEKKDKSG